MAYLELLGIVNDKNTKEKAEVWKENKLFCITAALKRLNP